MTHATIVALGALLLATPAGAADLFTITVPYEFASLDPSVTHVHIGCHVEGKDAVTQNTVNFGPAMGKSVDLPVAGKGGAVGTATVVFKTEDFSAKELASLNNVTGGSCRFGLRAGGTLYQPIDSSTGPVLGHKTGTPFRWKATFKF
jgi:hypothetical protein